LPFRLVEALPDGLFTEDSTGLLPDFTCYPLI
jgi:hypothetical protein